MNMFDLFFYSYPIVAIVKEKSLEVNQNKSAIQLAHI